VDRIKKGAYPSVKNTPIKLTVKEDMLMNEYKAIKDFSIGKETFSVLEQIAQEGARRMLQTAIENEVAEFLEKNKSIQKEDGRQGVVKNGHLPQRSLTTGIGPIVIKQPRVDDRILDKLEGQQRFTSAILPRYMRRVPSIDNLIPFLYLKGISTGDFPKALESILGKGASGLSATNIVRLKKSWEDDYRRWNKRSLNDKEYVYIWADGIYFNVRLESEKTCMLVIMGADKHGDKELISVTDGIRESEISWHQLLLDLRNRGLKTAPKLAIGDGALGFWKALEKVFPATRWQRCWVHKTANILDKLPKSIQSKAKLNIHEMYMAETKEKAFLAYDKFIEIYEAKYPRAVKCLTKDKDVLFNFYDFPAEQWSHIRTTNPIESTFATVRLRTKKTKGCGSRIATLTMVYKLALEAQKTWRKLRGYKLIPFVMKGKKFIDGVLDKMTA